MIRKILLATDGSINAHNAAKKTLELVLQLGNVSVTLFHVTSEDISKQKLLAANFDVLSLLKQDARLAIIQSELLFKNNDIIYDIAVSIGQADKEIIAKADSENYDLIVIGSRGLNKFQEILMGSISRAVASKAKAPVIIVKQ